MAMEKKSQRAAAVNEQYNGINSDDGDYDIGGIGIDVFEERTLKGDATGSGHCLESGCPAYLRCLQVMSPRAIQTLERITLSLELFAMQVPHLGMHLHLHQHRPRH